MNNSQNHATSPEPTAPMPKFNFVFPLQWEKVCMLEPIYLPDGNNGCRVHYDNGTFEDMYCRLNRVLDAWAEHELTTVEVTKELCRNWFGDKTKRRIPLALQPHLCLVPVKCRRRQRHNDCASGYVVLHKVRQVSVKTGGGSYIRFAGNPQPVPVLESRRFILDNLAHGRIVMEAYRNARVRMVVQSQSVLF